MLREAYLEAQSGDAMDVASSSSHIYGMPPRMLHGQHHYHHHQHHSSMAMPLASALDEDLDDGLEMDGLKKGPWTAQEDRILTAYVMQHGEGNWNLVQRNAGLRRCGKSCRLRWANHLRPDLKRGAFSPHEEALIVHMHAQIGNKWARMAAQLPGRTDNEIKNFWNTRIKRRLRAGLPVYSTSPDPPSNRISSKFSNLSSTHLSSMSSPYKDARIQSSITETESRPIGQSLPVLGDITTSSSNADTSGFVKGEKHLSFPSSVGNEKEKVSASSVEAGPMAGGQLAGRQPIRGQLHGSAGSTIQRLKRSRDQALGIVTNKGSSNSNVISNEGNSRDSFLLMAQAGSGESQLSGPTVLSQISGESESEGNVKKVLQGEDFSAVKTRRISQNFNNFPSSFSPPTPNVNHPSSSTAPPSKMVYSLQTRESDSPATTNFQEASEAAFPLGDFLPGSPLNTFRFPSVPFPVLGDGGDQELLDALLMETDEQLRLGDFPISDFACSLDNIGEGGLFQGPNQTNCYGVLLDELISASGQVDQRRTAISGKEGQHGEVISMAVPTEEFEKSEKKDGKEAEEGQSKSFEEIPQKLSKDSSFENVAEIKNLGVKTQFTVKNSASGKEALKTKSSKKNPNLTEALTPKSVASACESLTPSSCMSRSASESSLSGGGLDLHIPKMSVLEVKAAAERG